MKNRSLNEMKFEHGCLVAPSILAADFSRLGEAISGVETGGADLLHVDIMDGHFVPNLSMGPGVVSCIRKGSDLPFDVHLMLSEPGRYIEPFAKAGADHITVHVESRGDLADVIRRIHDLGCSAGVTLRPGTPATSLRPYLEMVEMVLVMTVEPGFGGASLRKMIDATGKKIYLEVDGGVAVGTARQVKAAGADVLVAGSSVFGSKNGFAAAIKAVREDA